MWTSLPDSLWCHIFQFFDPFQFYPSYVIGWKRVCRSWYRIFCQERRLFTHTLPLLPSSSSSIQRAWSYWQKMVYWISVFHGNACQFHMSTLHNVRIFFFNPDQTKYFFQYLHRIPTIQWVNVTMTWFDSNPFVSLDPTLLDSLSFHQVTHLSIIFRFTVNRSLPFHGFLYDVPTRFHRLQTLTIDMGIYGYPFYQHSMRRDVDEWLCHVLQQLPCLNTLELCHSCLHGFPSVVPSVASVVPSVASVALVSVLFLYSPSLVPPVGLSLFHHVQTLCFSYCSLHQLSWILYDCAQCIPSLQSLRIEYCFTLDVSPYTTSSLLFPHLSTIVWLHNSHMLHPRLLTESSTMTLTTNEFLLILQYGSQHHSIKQLHVAVCACQSVFLDDLIDTIEHDHVTYSMCTCIYCSTTTGSHLSEDDGVPPE